MVDRILQTARDSSYDFRKTAFAQDPLRHRFEEWVDYYRLKWAIAKVLAPKRILEVGVRYGYSALAFLDAAPEARYIGIDLDADSFGGTRGAIHWARSAAHRYDAHFLIANSQAMTFYPGGRYDLIHVDGQQDGEGSIHDITVALRQAEYVLVDGYFWTPDNFYAISECLLRHQQAIEFSVIIPGYAGELLIKTRKEVGSSSSKPAESSHDIRRIYTKDFYLNRLHGHDDFKKNRARVIGTPWHLALSLLAETAPAGAALDLGCGRGELAACLARQGRSVTAVDYSEDAIHLATTTVAASGVPKDGVHFCLADVKDLPLEDKFQLIVASDLIQRLSMEEVAAVFEKVSKLLAPSGLFLLFARPNAWTVRYALPQKRRLAKSIGAYLPSEHLNDPEAGTFLNPPAPALLKRRLKTLFRHSIVWVGQHNAPLEGLVRRLSRIEMKEAPAVLAAASNAPLSLENLVASSRMDILPLPVSGALRIKLLDKPTNLSSRNSVLIPIELENGTEFCLRSIGGHPVHLSYHWMEASGQRCVVHDGFRTPLVPSLAPGGTSSYWMRVQAPLYPGDYVLRVTLVQEGVRWFDTSPGGVYATAAIQVK